MHVYGFFSYFLRKRGRDRYTDKRRSYRGRGKLSCPGYRNRLRVSDGDGNDYKYDATLDRFTTAFNEMYLSLGGKISDFPYKKWKKKGEASQNGLDFIYYYLKSDNITLTATVEKKTLYLVNIGCAVDVEFFATSRDGKQKVMTVSGIIAAVAGGYKSDYVNFFDNLFVDATDREDGCFWYKNWIYLYEESKQTRMFRVMPATSEIAAEWNIEDYKNYWKKN